MIRCNLTRIGRILRLLRFHVHDLKLKPSLTVYQHSKQRLRFSRSGEPKIEEAWSRHFVVVGKRNPFAAQEAESTPSELPEPNEPSSSHTIETC